MLVFLGSSYGMLLIIALNMCIFVIENLPIIKMKKTRTSLALAGVILGVCSWAQTPVLDLQECLRIALSESPTIKVADLEVERMDYTKKETIGQLLPTVDFGASYNRSLAKQVMYMNMDFGSLGGGSSEEEIPQSRASKSDGGIKVGLDNSYSVGFSAALPLIAPQLWKSLSISDSQILRSVETAMQSRQNLVNQVKSAFYSLLLAKDSKKVIQESYDMAKLTYETYSKQFSYGAASEYDVLRTSVAMKNIEPELMQADVAIRQARLQLIILMGMNTDFEFEVTDKLSNYEKTMYEETLSINPDYANNADLRILDVDVQTLKKTVDLQKLAFTPTLALTANYNWTSMSNGNPFRNFRWNPYSSLGLSLSFPIFQGGQRVNRLKQAKVQLTELQLQRENLERSIAMQVDLALDNVQVNVKQIASCSESVSQAQRAYDIMVKSFDIGAASYLNLRDSELGLTRARLAYYQAIYNYLIARSELELLLGSAPEASLSK